MRILLRPPPRLSIPNYLTGESCSLIAADDNFRSAPERLAEIAAICNQPRVYAMLFARRLHGEAYSERDAQRFLDWAQRGWREQTHFVFLIIRPSEEVIGAMDIKSNTASIAEVGYWMNGSYPGWMTNALRELVRIAQQAGYESLFASVREENMKSIGVVTRAGFAGAEQFVTEGIPYRHYVKHLGIS